MTTSFWHGRQDEGVELMNAINHNCVCEYGLMGVRLSTCPPHEMLLDQRSLDGLLFVYSMRDRLLREEMSR